MANLKPATLFDAEQILIKSVQNNLRNDIDQTDLQLHWGDDAFQTLLQRRRQSRIPSERRGLTL